MPFKSEKQRRYMHANHPEIAKKWERRYGTGGHVSPSIKAKCGPVKLSNPGNKKFI
jgi:hypothetical protein